MSCRSLEGMDACKEPIAGGGVSADILTEFGRRCRNELRHLVEVIKRELLIWCRLFWAMGCFWPMQPRLVGLGPQWGVLKLSKVFKDSLQLLARGSVCLTA